MASHPKALTDRAGAVRLVLMDADGVLTDGRIYLLSNGSDARAYDARDGLAVRLGQSGGLRFGIVSGRSSPAVAARGEELDFVEIHQKVASKGACVEEIARRQNVSLEEVCFIGDDIVDVPALRRCGLAAAPADASPDVLPHVHFVGTRGGGRGIVREVVELILKARGAWDAASARYLKE